MKYILKLTVILLAITVVVAGLLGLVNHLTAERIADNTAKKANEAMQTVLPSPSYEKLEVSKEGITEAYQAEGGFVVRLNANGFGGAIDLMVGVSTDGTVTGVSVISHVETASLGAECTREDWRSQFTGADWHLFPPNFRPVHRRCCPGYGSGSACLLDPSYPCYRQHFG